LQRERVVHTTTIRSPPKVDGRTKDEPVPAPGCLYWPANVTGWEKAEPRADSRGRTARRPATNKTGAERAWFVFICYRRQGVRGVAGIVVDHLDAIGGLVISHMEGTSAPRQDL